MTDDVAHTLVHCSAGCDHVYQCIIMLVIRASQHIYIHTHHILTHVCVCQCVWRIRNLGKYLTLFILSISDLISVQQVYTRDMDNEIPLYIAHHHWSQCQVIYVSFPFEMIYINTQGPQHKNNSHLLLIHFSKANFRKMMLKIFWCQQLQWIIKAIIFCLNTINITPAPPSLGMMVTGDCQ